MDHSTKRKLTHLSMSNRDPFDTPAQHEHMAEAAVKDEVAELKEQVELLTGAFLKQSELIWSSLRAK